MSRPSAILGIDFTSAPGVRKPITCARATFDGDLLELNELERWHDFGAFEAALKEPGPWTAAIDFPFGQARLLVENMGWPDDWEAYVRHVASLDRKGFRAALEDYKRDRAPRDKHHKRQCDVLSGAQSPQTLFGTPVGLMFFEGAARVLEAGVHLPYHRDGDELRVVLEAYPGIAARGLLGKVRYKSDARHEQAEEQLRARLQLLELLRSDAARHIYGFAVAAPDEIASDPGADDLDALLCAVQATWGWRRRHEGYGAPPMVDRLEGWIADPSVLAAAVRPPGRPAA